MAANIIKGSGLISRGLPVRTIKGTCSEIINPGTYEKNQEICVVSTSTVNY